MSKLAFDLFSLIHNPDLPLDLINREVWDRYTKYIAAKLIAGDY